MVGVLGREGADWSRLEWREGRTYRIHCGSSVMLSPGVTMLFPPVRARLLGRGRSGSGMSVSLSASKREASWLELAL